ncbi:acyl-CoA dehydrogenase domain-containing protein [Gonapodya prolifera JEL478]|uniref:Acyl-CoA dehydrogenase domain-containing protein n=1 Tax=Gonapodya prolifera (strain JEL478) TaxID=1344416 RepID=A0A139AJL5_GONPJ|nr:acyl-CoA dehydrogenase domain-containing protein [Gonapodya prolifera JEL478]|eukprot:KXS16673.1 acyl-CoA dehydrogenase domain-containing protein [Gonapodya prolifera JEL478]
MSDAREVIPSNITPAGKKLKLFTRNEVATHNSAEDCWVVIDSYVYDLTRFADMHPGGALIITSLAGRDVTDEFYGLHRQEVLQKFGPRYVIGQILNEKAKVVNTYRKPGALSDVPYAEPYSVRPGFKSPYYDESHHRLRKWMRTFVEEHIIPDALEKEQSNERPSLELWKKMAAEGLHVARLGPGKHIAQLEKMGLKLPCGLTADTYTYFHEAVLNEELSRIGARGYGDGIGGGMVIGLPPVLNFGSEKLRNRIIPEVLKGEKFICLAITEAFAGSDVAGLTTTAKLTDDGKFWIVNGTKKWITNGTFADYFSTACRTDKGLTMILIERSFGGVETKVIKTSYSHTAGTSYVTFENVKVPVENTLGKVNDGLKVVLSNFNHERWVMCVSANRVARLILEECMKWADQRKVFGQKLNQQPVIRQKLASMMAKIEADTAWLESITYQMCNMTYAEMSEHLAGPIGLLKFNITRTAQLVADEAVQIFGGRAITKTGMGRLIELYQRTYKFDAILGGSEEILADLGVRQALKKMPVEKL